MTFDAYLEARRTEIEAALDRWLPKAPECPPLIVVMLGTMTGVTGGMLRDVVTAQVPLILRRDLYATAAIAGVSLYLVLQAVGIARNVAFAAGMAGVVVLRLLAIRWSLHLPVLRRPGSD